MPKPKILETLLDTGFSVNKLAKMAPVDLVVTLPNPNHMQEDAPFCSLTWYCDNVNNEDALQWCRDNFIPHKEVVLVRPYRSSKESALQYEFSYFVLLFNSNDVVRFKLISGC